MRQNTLASPEVVQNDELIRHDWTWKDVYVNIEVDWISFQQCVAEETLIASMNNIYCFQMKKASENLQKFQV